MNSNQRLLLIKRIVHLYSLKKKYLNKKRKRMHWIDLNSFYEYFDYESWEDNERKVGDIY